RDRDARVDPGQFLDGDRVLQGGAAGAADVLGKRDPHPAERRHLRDEFIRERLRAIELAGDRRNLLPRELTNGPLQQLGLVVEQEVHGGELYRSFIRSPNGNSDNIAAVPVRPSPTRPALKQRYERRQDELVRQ